MPGNFFNSFFNYEMLIDVVWLSIQFDLIIIIAKSVSL